MLIWQLLLRDAKTKRIDRDEEAAKDWIRKHCPGLFIRERNRRMRAIIETFDWAKAWSEWQRCFHALLWLSKRRSSRKRQRHDDADRMPSYVQEPVEEALRKTSAKLSSDYFSEAKIVPRFSAVFRDARQFQSLEEFWQVVFWSFFRPADLGYTVCGECGSELPTTRKNKKPSNAKVCAKCRLRLWREKNPERTRELWRNAKKQERKKK